MEYNFRTLNYLGSKLRLLDFIEGNVLNVTKEGEGVCDLFAGSGCVSYKLSNKFSVTSCDIQGYSRVISNALMKNFDVTQLDMDEFLDDVAKDSSLYNSFLPLITMEEDAITQRNLEILTDILEYGSVEVYSIEHNVSHINEQLQLVLNNLNNNGLLDVRSLISRYYGGVYFSYKQAVQIDLILEAISVYIKKDNRDLFLAALLSTASDVVGTVGKHFAQPIKARDSKGKIKVTVYNKAVKDKSLDVLELYREWLQRYIQLPKSNNEHIAIRGDYMDCLRALSDSVKTIYADPPYTRDHYSRFYHVLETITLRDLPELSTTNIHGDHHVTNGIYRNDRHQSPFCIKSQAPDAFKAMFEYAASTNRNLLLSYSPYDETKKSHPRVVTMQQLITWAKDYFSLVEIVSAGSFKHNKLNSVEHSLDASDEAELLIVCTNKVK
jgi:site-specific DNA-methyltransferase